MVASTIDWDELWTEPISDGGGETLQAVGTTVANDQDDLALLDAYSRAVVGAAERVGPRWFTSRRVIRNRDGADPAGAAAPGSCSPRAGTS